MDYWHNCYIVNIVTTAMILLRQLIIQILSGLLALLLHYQHCLNCYYIIGTANYLRTQLQSQYCLNYHYIIGTTVYPSSECDSWHHGHNTNIVTAAVVLLGQLII